MDSRIKAELEKYFGSADFLQILDIKNKEAYMNEPNDPFTARQAYLRSVLRSHPEATNLLSTDPGHEDDYKLRCKKLFIFQDIYDFLTSRKDDKIKARIRYFDKGEYPKLESVEIINDYDACMKKFGIPPFRGIAMELKEIYDNHKQKLKELQNFA